MAYIPKNKQAILLVAEALILKLLAFCSIFATVI
ncbi:hypothetical protein FYL58_22040 [Klebsiella aerogenes]|nr:hypothetical protein [Klebsiella aerogenes]EIW9500217.1 hypothetical protein [Klebsiella aerogenes]